MDNVARQKQAMLVAVVGVVVNLMLATIKCVVGVIGHSHALVADGIHSLSDLLTDFIVYIGSYFGNQQADDAHPYGHERIETAATFGVALILAGAGAGIIYEAIEDYLYEPVTATVPTIGVLVVVVISIVANELLFRYTLKNGEALASPLLKANAWHHRTDAISSVVVLFGVLLSFWGGHVFDLIAAFIVGCFIIKMAVTFGWESIVQLIDTAVDDELATKIEETILKVEGVQAVHQLRSRMMGSKILVDVHVLVAPMITVSEGHHIGDRVHQALMEAIPEITDVTVHIDPEDDEVMPVSVALPPRGEILPQIEACVTKVLPEALIKDAQLHYLGGRLGVTLLINLCSSNLQVSLADDEALNSALLELSEVSQVQLYYSGKS